MSSPLLSRDRMRVFFDGIWSEPRLSHPEGVAIGPDGWIWCGNHDGDICRIAPDGNTIERIAETGGFILGLAFDGDRALYVCDLKHAAVFRLDLSTHDLARLEAPGLRIPNYPVIDRRRGRLLVSDSHDSERAGPGIWSFDLAGGPGELWCDRAFTFANGLAMRSGEEALYVCETFAQSVSRVAIEPDGRAGAITPYVTNLPGYPDGLAFDDGGNLLISLYEPSRILRVDAAGTVNVLAEDPTAHVLCHPTNVAFDGNKLYAANLGRWHIAVVDCDIGATSLWRATA
ncbi:SMP-30/gluconolactonase/LRE family protein [Rhizobium mayense]|uniref:SMP-30/gluconolactonase/LRE family protein n=1 Tax=Rhizobium mayense TaxID=1312184 RepID=A0ABT7JP61_9HYPH|nr:SMP-30/gluconolactonase/LRE family protein [Rhizobium mayense]MDL2398136.1 SMP-30/gluconolactonase/LRE family protein [Rhizobium mayense]